MSQTKSVPPRSHGARLQRARHSFVTRQAVLPVEHLLQSESLAALVLMMATAVALAWANSPWSQSYFHLWETSLGFHIGGFRLAMNLHHWMNEAVMAIFFFLVGLEIKREWVDGHLARPEVAAFPFVAALGGMAVPALLYAMWNHGGPGEHGWGIPMATDIAFALGILALLGDRISPALRVFLLALATIDDLGAILVIALFYTPSLSLSALAVAAVLLGLIYVMRQLGVISVPAYIVVGALFWLAVLKTGIHATMAGVVLGLLTPARPWYSPNTFADASKSMLERFRNALRRDPREAETALGEIEELTAATEAPVHRLERRVRPWVIYGVLPLFALANAGVVLSGGAVGDAMRSPVTWGVITGLLFGKPLGIMLFSRAAEGAGWIALPDGLTWRSIFGVGLLAGVGFTVSLFLTGLAFPGGLEIQHARLAILLASLLAGTAGYLFLRRTLAT